MQYTSQQNDWLVQPFCQPASVEERDNQLILNNGLIQRTFVTSPNFATIDYTNQITGNSLLRGIKPEIVLTIDGHPFEVGGLKGQPDYAYLDLDWIAGLTSDRNAFQFREYRVGEPEIRYPWVRRRSATSSVYPPEGVSTDGCVLPLRSSVDGLCRFVFIMSSTKVFQYCRSGSRIRNEGRQPIEVDGLTL